VNQTALSTALTDELLESAGANIGRYVTTPSDTGVTETVNTRAVGRWEGYADALAPVIPILQPYIDAFGHDGSSKS
jgi:hypothetical protein